MGAFERLETSGTQTGRKNFDGQMFLSVIPSEYGKPIDFLDSFIGDGNTTNRSAVAVEENVSAQILSLPEDPVGCIRVVDMQAQEEIALRIEAVELVEAFGYLIIAIMALRAKSSRRSTNTVVVNQGVWLIFGGGGPEFEGGFFLEGAKQDRVRRIRKPFLAESFPKDGVFFVRGGADARKFPLQVAERFCVLWIRKRGEEK